MAIPTRTRARARVTSGVRGATPSSRSIRRRAARSVRSAVPKCRWLRAGSGHARSVPARRRAHPRPTSCRHPECAAPPSDSPPVAAVIADQICCTLFVPEPIDTSTVDLAVAFTANLQELAGDLPASTPAQRTRFRSTWRSPPWKPSGWMVNRYWSE